VHLAHVWHRASEEACAQMNANQQQYPFEPKLWCWDTEDVEGWLVEEGIGHFDSSGIFHYGIDPNDIDDSDQIHPVLVGF
jgi:hypothetical protein